MLYNYDYSKTMWMKIFMADPDFSTGTSKVYINYEQALEIIKTMDAITQGIQKIVYLVGWQGLGHDDCFPEMNVMNESLKRSCDATARESYMWLFEEAKKYHTIVSVHGNISDVYEASPSFNEMVKAGAVCQYRDGKPAAIEIFNGRNAYKTCYKEYWESGLFKKNWEGFMNTLPIKEAGTVHLDNFCIAENLGSSSTFDDQVNARNEIIDYITNVCGIDVTSEYTYREAPLRADDPYHPIHKYYGNCPNDILMSESLGPMHCLGRIAAYWWFSYMSPDDCVHIPVSVSSGHLNHEALFNVFYGSMHGEEIWRSHGTKSEDWTPEFIEKFCLQQLPYMYLNRYIRQSISEDVIDIDSTYRFKARFSENVISGGKGVITKDGKVLKKEGTVVLPLTDDNETFIAYSKLGYEGVCNMPDADFTDADLYEITYRGNVFMSRINVNEHKVNLNIRPGQALVIKKH